MSTGKSAAKREARRQRQLIAKQQRETQKLLAEEKDIELRQRRALESAQKGRDSLLEQQFNVSSLLGAGSARETTGGGAGGSPVSGGGGYFLPASDAGTPLYGRRSPRPAAKTGLPKTDGSGRTTLTRQSLFT